MHKVLIIVIFFIPSVFAQMNLNQNIISAFHSLQIDIIAPASGTSKEEFEKLQKLKMNLHVPLKCLDLSASKVLFCSHNDGMRFECLKEALYSKNNNIVWALRGGYGSARIIERLYNLPKPDRAKIVIGYSDITALHLFLSQEWGWQTIHGAVLTDFLKPEKDHENFIKIADFLQGKSKNLSINNIKPLNTSAVDAREVKGLITGGNLTIVETSIGTKWQIQTQNKIVFLEDVGIKPYQLDRSLLHLMQAKVFKNIKAIVFGSFSDDDELTIQTLKIFAKNINIPVYYAPQFGHNKANYPILYNSKGHISACNNSFYNLLMVP